MLTPELRDRIDKCRESEYYHGSRAAFILSAIWEHVRRIEELMGEEETVGGK